MSNEAMKAGRFLKWAKARKLLRRIQAVLAADGKVTVGTHTRATTYGSANASLFKATQAGLFVQRGKSWDCIDGCGFRFSIPIETPAELKALILAA